MKNIKNKKFHISQISNRVLTCWITKGWRKGLAKSFTCYFED